MRRARIHIIKIVISVVIILGIFYFLFSNSDAHARAKQAIHARFKAHKTKESPKLVTGLCHLNSSLFVVYKEICKLFSILKVWEISNPETKIIEKGLENMAWLIIYRMIEKMLPPNRKWNMA